MVCTLVLAPVYTLASSLEVVCNQLEKEWDMELDTVLDMEKDTEWDTACLSCKRRVNIW